MCYDVCYEWYHTDHNSLENLNQFIDKFPKNLLQCMCVCLSIQYPRPKYAYEQVRGSKWRIRLFLYVLLLKFISKISSLLLILGENIPQSFFLYANNILFLIIFNFFIIYLCVFVWMCVCVFHSTYLIFLAIVKILMLSFKLEQPSGSVLVKLRILIHFIVFRVIAV